MKKLVKNENAPQIVDIYEKDKESNNYHDEYMEYMKVKVKLIESIIELIERI